MADENNSNDGREGDDDRPDYAVEPKLFGRWSYEGISSPDSSLTNYLTVKPTRQQVFVPYTAGRYQQRRFKKAQCPIVERITCMLMTSGHRNNGKKQKAVKIIKQTMELIHLLTDEIINASKGSSGNSFAVRKKDEIERVAKGNR